MSATFAPLHSLVDAVNTSCVSAGRFACFLRRFAFHKLASMQVNAFLYGVRVPLAPPISAAQGSFLLFGSGATRHSVGHHRLVRRVAAG